MGRSSRVLIVDDSAAVRQHLAIVLREAGHTVVEAHDGVDGAARIDTDFGIELVLCDVEMPRMGGLDLLVQVRRHERTQRLPVVMLAGHSEEEVVRRARQAGAQGWMVKPIRPEALVSTVQKLTDR